MTNEEAKHALKAMMGLVDMANMTSTDHNDNFSILLDQFHMAVDISCEALDLMELNIEENEDGQEE